MYERGLVWWGTIIATGGSVWYLFSEIVFHVFELLFGVKIPHGH